MIFYFIATGAGVERRTLADRRKVHMFVSEERRKGPHDRRGAEQRRRERTLEREKIEKIQSFKEKKKLPASPASPVITKKLLVCIGLTLLLLVIVLFALN